MEIEAKWDTDEATFNSIVAAFPEGGSKYGYDLNVRWGGVPRRYSDLYYDDPSGQLVDDLHAFRHRQRHSTGGTIAITDGFAALATSGWATLNWEKVQYKSTPTRLAAVWFRTEQGDAELTAAQVTQTLDGNPPMPPYTAADDPIGLLLGDHPGFDFAQRQVVLDVVQYRHRVEFQDQTTGAVRYELSLDKVVTTTPAGPSVESFAVELEAERSAVHTEASIDGLLALMLTMEQEYGLVRAVTSKGGLPVPDTAGPEMRLEATTLDYGPVEVGFAFTRAIVVHNDGYAPLSVTVQAQPPGTPEDAWWEPTEYPTPIEVPVGGPPLAAPQIFRPADVGPASFDVVVAGDDTAYPEQVVALLGTGMPATPIDTVLVLDRSGSMGDTAGDRRKIDAMRDAADLYAHLLRADTGAGTGDAIGLAKYNENSSVYIGLERADDPTAPGSHLNQLVEERLSDAALADPGRLEPTGATGIGGAMVTGAAMFALPAGDRRHVMVVLTDGKENRSPEIADVLDDIQAANPELAMYSVGVGEEVEEAKLQAITNVGNGYHQVTGDLGGLDVFALELFYFKIFANAAGLDLAVDPTAAVPLTGDPVVVHRARITSSDRSATFVILARPELRKLYQLELVTPDGQVMGPGVVAGGVAVHFLERRSYTLCRIALPEGPPSAGLLGDWTVRLSPGHGGDIDDHPSAASVLSRRLVPIGFAAAVASDYRMEVQAIAQSQGPLSAVTLVARLTERGWPTTDAEVDVEVIGPSGPTVTTVGLEPDGSGALTGTFLPDATIGSYHVVFRSRGRNTAGEVVPREASRVITVGPEPSGRPTATGGPGCLPRALAALALSVIVLALILLVLALA